MTDEAFDALASKIGRLERGDKVRRFYSKAHFGNALYHVRGRVDGRLVVREWLKNKRRWTYSVKEPWELAMPARYSGTVTIETASQEKKRQLFDGEIPKR